MANQEHHQAHVHVGPYRISNLPADYAQAMGFPGPVIRLEKGEQQGGAFLMAELTSLLNAYWQEHYLDKYASQS